MGFPRQEYWSGLPCPPPRDLLDPGIESPYISCTGRQVLYQLELSGKPICDNTIFKCSHILRFWEIVLQYIFLPCHALCAQSCPVLCDPMDCTLSLSPVPEIVQARTLEWVAISFSIIYTLVTIISSYVWVTSLHFRKYLEPIQDAPV